MTLPELIVGYVTKPHGLKGDVLVHLITSRLERIRVGSVLLSDRGPMTIVASSQRNDRWCVHFAGVDDRSGAESIAKLELRAEPLDDPDALWVHEMVGARVVLTDGTDVGSITGLESSPASDLLVLDSGALVPLVFVVSAEPGVVTIDPPVGLLDLNDAL